MEEILVKKLYIGLICLLLAPQVYGRLLKKDLARTTATILKNQIPPSLPAQTITANQKPIKSKKVRFPMTAAKGRFTECFTHRKYDDALTLAESCKDVSEKIICAPNEINIFSHQLSADISAAHDKVVKGMFSTLRSNCWWLLPTSTALVASTQEPKLLALGTLGITLGSFGFKKCCDYFADKLRYNALVKIAQRFDKIFNTKEKELKTK